MMILELLSLEASFDKYLGPILRSFVSNTGDRHVNEQKMSKIVTATTFYFCQL